MIGDLRLMIVSQNKKNCFIVMSGEPPAMGIWQAIWGIVY
jgi:hypothetical protein